MAGEACRMTRETEPIRDSRTVRITSETALAFADVIDPHQVAGSALAFLGIFERGLLQENAHSANQYRPFPA